ncbi:MAG TPA: L-rhamnose mutarotase [Anaerolineales bacterium]|nr:L-rhamnose mutarotase [Anaerolineales bacterium]
MRLNIRPPCHSVHSAHAVYYFMIRKAFVMTLKPENQAEYEARHNPIWPELQQVLKSNGVHNYSIFLDRETDRLFAYAEIESEELWQKIAETDACRKWWAHMKDIMFTNADKSPIAEDLREVFHID